MLRPYPFPLVVSLTLVVLLSASCGDTADDSADTTLAPTTATAEATITTTTQPPTTTTSEPPVAARPLRLVFDGEGCTYDGPMELAAGPVDLSYTNLSEGRASIAFNRHTGDETIQDAIDHFGAGPSPIPCPSWKSDVVRTSVAPGDTFSWEGELEPAIYHMVCYRMPPLEVWFGTGLAVGG